MKKEIDSFNKVPGLPSLIELDELDLEQAQGGRFDTDCGTNCGTNCGTYTDVPVVIS